MLVVAEQTKFDTQNTKICHIPALKIPQQKPIITIVIKDKNCIRHTIDTVLRAMKVQQICNIHNATTDQRRKLSGRFIGQAFRIHLRISVAICRGGSVSIPAPPPQTDDNHHRRRRCLRLYSVVRQSVIAH